MSDETCGGDGLIVVGWDPDAYENIEGPSPGCADCKPTCAGCDDGAYDILRPCAACGRSVVQKREARAARGLRDADRYAFGNGLP